ncbi:MAG TPA: hypothetical protein VKA59_13025 [Vicinamibacterales bacterium]|nr:hypothetical protein [Vicinamibacterales bacterium]
MERVSRYVELVLAKDTLLIAVANQERVTASALHLTYGTSSIKGAPEKGTEGLPAATGDRFAARISYVNDDDCGGVSKSADNATTR